MARPRSDGSRYPSGDLRPRRLASVVEAEQQTVQRQENDDIDADLLAISRVMTPKAFHEWAASGCDVCALPLDVQRYVQQRRQLRADAKRWAHRERMLIEKERQLAGTYATA